MALVPVLVPEGSTGHSFYAPKIPRPSKPAAQLPLPSEQEKVDPLPDHDPDS